MEVSKEGWRGVFQGGEIFKKKRSPKTPFCNFMLVQPGLQNPLAALTDHFLN
jgi:hypothetical protein